MKSYAIILSLILTLGFTTFGYASLHDRGGGLIYDDVLNVTWLKDANYAKTSGYDSDGLMTWSEATTWATNLSYYDSVRNVTWTGWRLPYTLPVNGTSYGYDYAINGSTDEGYNVSAPASSYPGSTGSEMAYMFYNNLANKGYYTVNGLPMPS